MKIRYLPCAAEMMTNIKPWKVIVAVCLLIKGRGNNDNHDV